MGLEPTRYCYHRHLKPARLPIPPLLRTNDILSNFLKYVNRKNNLKKSKNLLTIIASFAIITESLTDMRQIQMRGSVGTGRRARLRILWSLRSCGFKSHLPHKKPLIFKGFFFWQNRRLRLFFDANSVIQMSKYLIWMIFLKKRGNPLPGMKKAVSLHSQKRNKPSFWCVSSAG